MAITKEIHNGMIILSAIIDGVRVKHRYSGYSTRDCIKMFKKEYGLGPLLTWEIHWYFPAEPDSEDDYEAKDQYRARSREQALEKFRNKRKNPKIEIYSISTIG